MQRPPRDKGSHAPETVTITQSQIDVVRFPIPTPRSQAGNLSSSMLALQGWSGFSACKGCCKKELPIKRSRVTGRMERAMCEERRANWMAFFTSPFVNLGS